MSKVITIKNNSESLTLTTTICPDCVKKRMSYHLPRRRQFKMSSFSHVSHGWFKLRESGVSSHESMIQWTVEWTVDWLTNWPIEGPTNWPIEGPTDWPTEGRMFGWSGGWVNGQVNGPTIQWTVASIRPLVLLTRFQESWVFLPDLASCFPFWDVWHHFPPPAPPFDPLSPLTSIPPPSSTPISPWFIPSMITSNWKDW